MKQTIKQQLLSLIPLAIVCIIGFGFGYIIGLDHGYAAYDHRSYEPTTEELVLSEVDTIVLACLADAKENGLVMDVISVMSIDEITPEPFGDKWIDKTITACNDHLSILGLQLNEVGFYPLN